MNATPFASADEACHEMQEQHEKRMAEWRIAEPPADG